MVLEDFFTLTEMKDGLTALARVDELVTVMQTSDGIMKDTGDIARQWSTVATILAATGNKDCLKHFIQSDGLQFLNQWLQVAQKCEVNTSDSSVDESISGLLGALEKLPIDEERLNTCGIRETIKPLLTHKSLNVQEIARRLFDSWHQIEDTNSFSQDVIKGGTCCDGNEDEAKLSDDMKVIAEDRCAKSPMHDAFPIKEAVEGSLSEHSEATRKDDDSQSEIIKDVKITTSNQDASPTSSKQEDVNGHQGGVNSSSCSPISNTRRESSGITEHSSLCPVEATTSVGTCSSLVPGDQNLGDKTHFSVCLVEVTTSVGTCSSLVPGDQNLGDKTHSVLCPVEVTTSVGTCSSLVPGDQNLGDKSSDVSLLKDGNVDDRSSDDNNGMMIEMAMKESSKHSKKEMCSTHSKFDQLDDLSACPANAQSSMIEPDESCDMDVESLSCVRKTASAGLVDAHGVMEAQIESGTVDCGMPKYSRSTAEAISDVQEGKCHADFLQDLADSGCISRQSEGPKASCHRKEAFRAVGNIIERVSKPDSYARKGDTSLIAFLKPAMDTKELGEVDGTGSDVELDYGLDDALEVARRVAKEVEREVVDYRGPFCSSSSGGKLSKGEIMQPNSPDSVGCKHDESMVEKINEDGISVEQDPSDGGLSPKRKRLRTSNESDSEPDCQTRELELPKTAAVTQETNDSNHKNMCDFDLNEDVNTEDIECSVTVNQPIFVTAPIPVVAALKGAPVSRTTPLHFGGELGWRGSATTSAFRRASPRRTPDWEKTSLIEESSNSSKQRQNLFEIDLNVAVGDGDALNLASSPKHVPESSGLHSADSSVEVSSTKAERLKLDLNRVGDSEDACILYSSDWKVKGQLFNHQNGKRVQSPASSSSSRRTPMRDFDLNDNPAFFDACVSHDHRVNNDKAQYQNTKAYGRFKPDDPVVSIMGPKIDVNRKEFVNRDPSFLMNGLHVESSAAASLVRAGATSQSPLIFPPTQHPTYGYNGLMMRPPMSLHPQFYCAPGNIPYMVDSRVYAVTPHMMGSSSAAASSFARPFLMSPTDAPLGSSGAGFLPSGLDLNSVATSVAAEGNEMGTFRQLFVQGPGSLMEEQMKSAGAGTAVKRKEPEYAWEMNPFGYKHEPLRR
ncbi:hypothetical protein MRB53_024908 [Persea americana]|uniref:Uncharacterized protein n=1 Tax=Persea americana TaxID=3435 RepID=A0ACC2LE28_PERAE|nr:hypothetical protein MRB53_024908 [Persea americana]